MFNLLFMLSRIVVVPYELIVSPFRASSSVYRESGRGRAMMLGLPSVLVAALGIGLLSWAEYGNKGDLIDKYDAMAEKAREKNVRITSELRAEYRLRSSNGQGANSRIEVDKDDPRIVESRALIKEEQIYLEKLIWLDPDEPEYRYRLAKVAGAQGDNLRYFSLMNSIAPDDEPGYAKAHLWMANFFYARGKSKPQELRGNVQKALRHVEHSLVRENENLQALYLKAELLKVDRRFVDAYRVYEQLFETNPRVYSQLIAINNFLGGENVKKNSIILDQAELKFREALVEASVDYDGSWSRVWVSLCSCLVVQKEYATLEKLLKKEEIVQKKQVDSEGTPEAASRYVHIRHLLTELYTQWATSIDESISEEGGARRLELLKQALDYKKNNVQALQMIAQIAAGNSALSAEAKEIYDPELDDDAPAGVLDVLGSRALAAGDYENAIKYFELARRKSPNDPKILNNLAFAYLVCENRNPDRALTLVNQAIQKLPNISSVNERRSMASHFFDTRGRALMQMNRMDEAAAALELAMQMRPENENILAALIECYDGRDSLQAEVYRKRLEELKAKEKIEAGSE